MRVYINEAFESGWGRWKKVEGCIARPMVEMCQSVSYASSWKMAREGRMRKERERRREREAVGGRMVAAGGEQAGGGCCSKRRWICRLSVDLLSNSEGGRWLRGAVSLSPTSICCVDESCCVPFFPRQLQHSF